MACATHAGTSLKRAGSSSGSLSRAGSAELARPAGGSEDGGGGRPVQSGNLWRLPGARKLSPLGGLDGLSRRRRHALPRFTLLLRMTASSVNAQL